MVSAHINPCVVLSHVVDVIGTYLSEFLVEKVINPYGLRCLFRLPFLSSIF
ncbi:MAG: hypothetical protein DDT20_01910 [Firmicutes bacterium]|nr:hypothetical protein [Bacillota bacterium]